MRQRVLQAKAKQRSLPLDEVLAYARGVTSGLWAAHERGIIHRDVKPENLLVFRTPDGRLELFAGYPWSRDNVRVDFVEAVHRFLLSEHNQSFLTPQMLRLYLQCLGGSGVWGPVTTKIEQPEPPVVAITSPGEGDVIRGDRAVLARANSDHPITHLTLHARAGDLEMDLAAELEHDDQGVTATALLPVAQLVDGVDVVVSAEAQNTIGYRATDSITLPVNVHAPALRLEGGEPHE